jgi:hypothetical protein
MKYNDLELFEVDEEWLDIKKKSESFNDFCDWAMVRLQVLVEESMVGNDWFSYENKRMRTYRQDAIEFYREKRGK